VPQHCVCATELARARQHRHMCRSIVVVGGSWAARGRGSRFQQEAATSANCHGQGQLQFAQALHHAASDSVRDCRCVLIKEVGFDVYRNLERLEQAVAAHHGLKIMHKHVLEFGRAQLCLALRVAVQRRSHDQQVLRLVRHLGRATHRRVILSLAVAAAVGKRKYSKKIFCAL